MENHPIFPERANISIAAVLSPDHARTRTWERGAGLTEACGSAACAVLACGVRTGRLERKATISVPGGDLEIEWSGAGGILMTGPAELEFTGHLHLSSATTVTIEV